MKNLMKKRGSILLTALLVFTFVACDDDPEPTLKPVARLSANPLTGQAPLTVTFDASQSTGTNITYMYDFGDGSDAKNTSDATVTHTYTDAGSYTATLTVKDDDSQTDTASVEVVVQAPTTPNPDPDPNPNPNPDPEPTPNAAPRIDTFTAEAGRTALDVPFIKADVSASDNDGDTLTYTWRIDDKNVGTNSPALYYESAALTQDEHTVKVIVSDGTAQVNRSQVVNIGAPTTAPPQPTPDEAALRGTLVSTKDDTPVAGADVMVYDASVEAEIGQPGTEPRYTTTTDAEGNFSFMEIDPGSYIVVVEREGFVALRETVLIVAEETKTLTLNISPQKQVVDGVTGVVYSSLNDTPVAGATVKLRLASDVRQTRTTQTNAQGEFVFENVAEENYYLTIEQEGFEIFEQYVGAQEVLGISLGKLVLEAEALNVFYGSVSNFATDISQDNLRVVLDPISDGCTSNREDRYEDIVDENGLAVFQEVERQVYWVCLIEGATEIGKSDTYYIRYQKVDLRPEPYTINPFVSFDENYELELSYYRP